MRKCEAAGCEISIEGTAKHRKYCSEKCRYRTKDAGRDYAHKKNIPCRICGDLRWGGPTALPAGELTCHKCRREIGPPIHALETLRERAIETWTPIPEGVSMSKLTTTQKGLGHIHVEAVKYLKQRHKDGSPCDWCGRPMWLNPVLNWDYNPDPEAKVRGNGVLQGDHSVMTRSECLRRGEPVLPPDRLLHAECNRQRGAGGNDHLAATAQAGDESLSMPWPW